MSDNVNHPPHYKHPSGVECIDVIEGFDLNLAQVIKYAWRAGAKTPDAEEDLRKALWYLDREVARQALPDMVFEERNIDAISAVCRADVADGFVAQIVSAADRGMLREVRELLLARLHDGLKDVR